MVAADGAVFAFGDAAFYGSWAPGRSTGPRGLAVPRVPATGSWPPTAGSSPSAAPPSSARPACSLDQPVVGIRRPPGDGYLTVAADGGIFAFGEFGFYGWIPQLPRHPPTGTD